ncbi:hypothetical protein KILIM_121_00090 [Kineosphaera limosa NBRC 100340]|uniref:Exonuclease domain-containing protein n=3 Tax=Kineosphaera TaxID=211469 RepID=K6X1R7_9MICO|nr:hypothetical protein KILIM_121_00090 [Kineosphaera limosa NBRC 100340]
MAGYTVIDVETTGLSPSCRDRVVEIAVVWVSHDGEIQDQWVTLVNPGRDVGPTHIHGITATAVAAAPTFDEIAPYVLRALVGRIAVAHNAPFDLRFLASEFHRVGLPLTDLPLRGVCTMAWAPFFVHSSSRKLADCCAASGVALKNPHSAMDDALATAQMFQHFLRLAGGKLPWQEDLDAARVYRWPTYSGPYGQLRLAARSEGPNARQDEWLDGIVSRMPRAANPLVDSYLGVLEMAMLDGFLAEHEKAELVSVAVDSGLTRGHVLDLHADYLRAMAEVALEDHIVTPGERADIERVAAALGLRLTDVEMALAEAQQRAAASNAARTALATAVLSLEPGDRVVFTGDMTVGREEWIALAREHNLDPGGVTRTTKVVVASDPNSMSGKAIKARAYGIPIITEASFAKLLKQFVEAQLAR